MGPSRRAVESEKDRATRIANRAWFGLQGSQPFPSRWSAVEVCRDRLDMWACLKEKATSLPISGEWWAGLTPQGPVLLTGFVVGPDLLPVWRMLSSGHRENRLSWVEILELDPLDFALAQEWVPRAAMLGDVYFVPHHPEPER